MAGLESSTFAKKGPPRTLTGIFKQKSLQVSARIDSPALESGRNHTRCIEDQAITRSKVFAQIPDLAMLNCTTLQMHDHHPRRITWLYRLPCNEFGIQVKVKLIGCKAHPG